MSLTTWETYSLIFCLRTQAPKSSPTSCFTYAISKWSTIFKYYLYISINWGYCYSCVWDCYTSFIMYVCITIIKTLDFSMEVRGGSRTAATSKMERFVIIVNGFQPLTIITKRSILDVAAVLDPPLEVLYLI